MNEVKHQRIEYSYPSISASQQRAYDIFATIQCLMKDYKLSAHDWVVLNAMAKQINQRKHKLPRKVLRAMERKLEMIQNNNQKIK